MEKQQERTKKSTEFLRKLGMFIVIALVIQVPKEILGATLYLTGKLNFIQNFIFVCLFLADIAFLFLLFRKKFRFRLKTIKLSKMIFCTFGVYAIVLVARILILLIFGNKTTLNNEVIQSTVSDMSKILFFVNTAIFAPIAEELLFREYLMGVALKNYPKIALAVSTVLFISIHIPTDLYSLLLYGSISFALSFMYYKTKQVEYTIGLHFLNNLIAALLLILR